MRSKELIYEIIRFGIVGGFAFIVDYLILIICKEFLLLDVLVSSAIAFAISTIFNYILSIKWVFDIKEKERKNKKFIVFIIFSIIGLCITQFIMYIGCKKLIFNYLFVKVFATIIVMVFNYLTRKKILK